MAKEKNIDLPVVNEGDLHTILQQLREKSGYSLTQMADALCLSEDTLEKLEDEDFQSLAEPPYIRGYLRNYAKLADSDPSELIRIYESLRGAEPSELDYHFKTGPSVSRHSKSKISPVVAQVLFLGLLLALIGGILMIPAVNQWITKTWSSFSNQTSSQDNLNSDNPLLTGSMPVPVPLPDDNSNKPESETPPTADKADSTKAPLATATTDINDQKALETDTANTIEKKQALDNKPEETEKTPQTNNKKINIKLVFNKEVWLRIRDKDKKTLFEATNAAGKEKVLDLKKPLTFRVGNAQGLSLFVDGKPVDISGYIKGSVANFTLE